MKHIIEMLSTKSRYWYAKCTCGWTGERKARIAEAERLGLAHVQESK